MKQRRPKLLIRLSSYLNTRLGRGAFLACAFLILGSGAYGIKANYDPGPLSAVQHQGQPINGYSSHADFEQECRHCHAPVRCLSANLCQDCHKEIARQRSEASGLHGLLPGTDKCQSCHEEHQGRDIVISAVPFVNINHEALTGFSLARHHSEGEGRPDDCHDCHPGGRYDEGSVDCYGCHDEQDPDGLTSHIEQYGRACLECHDGRDRMIDVDHETIYALDGAHAEAECTDCHGDSFLAAGRDCVDCHEDPEVHAGEFGLDCGRCHTAAAWEPAELREHAFALDHGDEGLVECETCHTGTYTIYTCYGCHDHEPGEMRTVHDAEGITGLEPCGECHPTGRPDEALAIMQAAATNDGQ